ELEVLTHGEILVEAEALRHVTDAALDLFGLGAQIEAEAGALPAVRREQPAQHADGRGLAGAVGAEEAVDRAAAHLHGKIAHHRPAVEPFGQAVDVDHDVGRRHRAACAVVSSTLTGWPTRRFSGCCGRASIRNTSLARSSRL